MGWFPAHLLLVPGLFSGSTGPTRHVTDITPDLAAFARGFTVSWSGLWYLSIPTYSIGKGWTMRRALTAAAAAAAITVLAAACGSSTQSGIRQLQQQGGAAPRVPGEHHARQRADRDQEGLLRQGSRQERDPEAVPVQHRHRGGHGPAGRPARRRLRRPEPGHQGLADLERQADQGHLRRRLGRRRAGGQEGHHQRRPSSRARSWPPRRSATPRTWRCATGSSSTT